MEDIKILTQISEHLKTINIHNEVRSDLLVVSRDDMCKVFNVRNKIPEEKGGAYDLALKEIRSYVLSLTIEKNAYWAGKDDDYYFLEIR